jgi:hypothetical protein
MKQRAEGPALVIVFLAAIAFATLFSVPPPAPAFQNPQADRQANAPARHQNLPPDFMGVAGITGWTLSGTPRTFAKESLYGYIDGGAEIFLQYGFRNLWVFQFVPDKPAAKKKEITLEIYQMASPAAAFGIFSMRREGNEPVSPGIKTAHWIGQEQANLVKGALYVNILATDCTQDEVGGFAMSLDRELPAAGTLLPRAFFCMPEFNLVRGTERYICGIAAATSESALLGADFWGFNKGLAEAYSVKYSPGSSRLVLIRFSQPPEGLWDDVLALFNEYLMDVSVLQQVVQGQTVAGHKFYFGWNGRNGIMITDEPDPEVAHARIRETLDRAGNLLDKR